MSSTARALHNSGDTPSGKSDRFFREEEIAELMSRLDIPRHLKRTLPIFWALCGRPYGREIRLWKSLEDFARAAEICLRTARYHARAFERLELVEVAVASDGKRLVANTLNRPTTYRFRTETLVRNRWPECKRCGHKHQADRECGCDLGERRGRFHSKSGVIQKPVKRTCRCRPSPHVAPAPMRPQRVTPPPAAQPVVEHQHRTNARPQPKLSKTECAKFIGDMATLIKGNTRHVESVGGMAYDLDPGDPRYRPKMNYREALDATCKLWKRTQESVIDALKFWGFQIEGDS